MEEKEKAFVVAAIQEKLKSDKEKEKEINRRSKKGKKRR